MFAAAAAKRRDLGSGCHRPCEACREAQDCVTYVNSPVMTPAVQSDNMTVDGAPLPTWRQKALADP